jgi:hypothetical protein
MRFQYDKSSKWLIETHADAILRLAGVGPVKSWHALPGELVQSRQLPDGLVEVVFPNRSERVLHLIEISTYPDNRVPEQLLDDIATENWNLQRHLLELDPESLSDIRTILSNDERLCRVWIP